MTERFELKMEENKWYFYDNVEDDYIYSKHSVCRLLNTLHQEVIAQKSLANYYRQKYKKCEKFIDDVKGEVVIKR